MSEKSKEQNPSEEKGVSKETVERRMQKELGERKGLEPTRYGDWELNGKCVDF